MKYHAVQTYDHKQKLSAGIHFTIDVNGMWYFHGEQSPGPIHRDALVTLFAKKALKKIEGRYFLKTPHECYEVAVEDVPFIITDFEEDSASITLISNIGETVRLDKDHTLFLKRPAFAQQKLPYIYMNNDLEARLHPHIYDQLIQIALQQNSDLKEGEILYLISDKARHPLAVWEVDV